MDVRRRVYGARRLGLNEFRRPTAVLRAGEPRSRSVAAVPDDDRARLLDAVEADLADVELALARLEAGTYETCEVCAGRARRRCARRHTGAARRCITCADAPSDLIDRSTPDRGLRPLAAGYQRPTT